MPQNKKRKYFALSTRRRRRKLLFDGIYKYSIQKAKSKIQDELEHQSFLCDDLEAAGSLSHHKTKVYERTCEKLKTSSVDLSLLSADSVTTFEVNTNEFSLSRGFQEAVFNSGSHGYIGCLDQRKEGDFTCYGSFVRRRIDSERIVANDCCFENKNELSSETNDFESCDPNSCLDGVKGYMYNLEVMADCIAQHLSEISEALTKKERRRHALISAPRSLDMSWMYSKELSITLSDSDSQVTCPGRPSLELTFSDAARLHTLAPSVCSDLSQPNADSCDLDVQFAATDSCQASPVLPGQYISYITRFEPLCRTMDECITKAGHVTSPTSLQVIISSPLKRAVDNSAYMPMAEAQINRTSSHCSCCQVRDRASALGLAGIIEESKDGLFSGVLNTEGISSCLAKNAADLLWSDRFESRSELPKVSNAPFRLAESSVSLKCCEGAAALFDLSRSITDGTIQSSGDNAEHHYLHYVTEPSASNSNEILSEYKDDSFHTAVEYPQRRNDLEMLFSCFDKQEGLMQRSCQGIFSCTGFEFPPRRLSSHDLQKTIKISPCLKELPGAEKPVEDIDDPLQFLGSLTLSNQEPYCLESSWDRVRSMSVDSLIELHSNCSDIGKFGMTNRLAEIQDKLDISKRDNELHDDDAQNYDDLFICRSGRCKKYVDSVESFPVSKDAKAHDESKENEQGASIKLLKLLQIGVSIFNRAVDDLARQNEVLSLGSELLVEMCRKLSWVADNMHDGDAEAIRKFVAEYCRNCGICLSSAQDISAAHALATRCKLASVVAAADGMVREIGQNYNRPNSQLQEENDSVGSIFENCVDRSDSPEYEVAWTLNRSLLPGIDNMLYAREMGHEIRGTSLVKTKNDTAGEHIQSEKQGECGDLLRAIYRDLEAWSFAHNGQKSSTAGICKWS